jgi:hypothetical protein
MVARPARSAAWSRVPRAVRHGRASRAQKEQENAPSFIRRSCSARIGRHDETHIVFDDGTSQAIIHYHATVTGGGGTLVLDNNVNEVISSESFRAAGTPFRVSTVDGRTLANQAGLLIFEFADGTLTFHGSLRPAEGFSFCEALEQQAP